MSLTIWIDGWQMQCCGEPFRLGSQVTWTLRAVDPDWLKAVLGAQASEAVDAAEEHHTATGEDAEPISGTVTRIRTVHCRYTPRPDGDPGILYPMPGSGAQADVESADGWTADCGEERFVGYLVQLD